MNERIYFTDNDITIINDDFLATELIPEGSIDLTVTSPPYNVGIEYDNHEDEMPYEDYLDFSRQWLSKCLRVTKDDGRLCLNIPLDKNKGGQQSICADITTIAKGVGWNYHSTIIWNEQNISRRTAWGSWQSASAPYVIAPVEVIIVLYKQSWKKQGRTGKSGITDREFMEWTNGLWTFSGESAKRVGHPAPFPLELPRRCIKLFSFVGDTVLDPFLGSGTTLVACAQNKRAAFGVEVAREYCVLAKRRVRTEGREVRWPPKTITDLVKQYFDMHPGEELPHGPVVDWVTQQWLKEHNHPPRDVWRAIRKLCERGHLQKVARGVYKR